MKIGFVGLGRIGMPVACAIATKGHQVFGYDRCAIRQEIVRSGKYPIAEFGIDEILKAGAIQLKTLAQVVNESDIVFIAVSTPHPAKFQGVKVLEHNTELVDFDYSLLKAAVTEVATVTSSKKIVCIMSTCSPTTIETQILPLVANKDISICYTPELVQLGTVIKNVLEPELFVIGGNDEDTVRTVASFFVTLNSEVPLITTTIRDAEMIKMAYNWFACTKMAFINSVGQLCAAFDCDADVVSHSLLSSRRKLFGDCFFRAATPAGGPCFPRDFVVFAHLAQRTGVGSSFAEGLLRSRDEQARWLAKLLREHGENLPKVILGTGFKRDVNTEMGSVGLLVASILETEFHETVFAYDPLIHKDFERPDYAAAFLVSVNHSCFATNYRFPTGSVVVDPWRIIQPQQGVTVHSVGRGANPPYQNTTSAVSGDKIVRTASARCRSVRK